MEGPFWNMQPCAKLLSPLYNMNGRGMKRGERGLSVLLGWKRGEYAGRDELGMEKERQKRLVLWLQTR